ncbi:GDSL-type esterase/lipase family protein [uncultured Duncaniella sp.]|uniref:GDSL-type esterase/lipase family protein n=1 Tax=uncultured Duncaniella sp. TaxID=2768039 RepID=UPI0025D544BA|nr:GDSL-type esterase/lipase family protein [uncultured Duncaniella sp.]
MTLYHKFLFSLTALAFAPVVWGQTPVSEPSQTEEIVDETEDLDRTVREDIVDIPEEADDIDIPIPAFIKRSANHIIFNGADWSCLRKAFEQSKVSPVSIVHIGDSHVQADINTGTTRELLQYDFGNAGRGLIAPLKICGTNQPTDYLFQSRNSWNAVKLMNNSWIQTVGFTGTSIRPASPTSELTIGTRDTDDYNPFTSTTLFHNGKLTVKEVTDSKGNPLHFRAIPSRDYTQIVLADLATQINVKFASAGDLTLYGASLSGDRPGVFYHAIGNNGATYDSYNRIGTVGVGINPLQPNLVIISLGTNEAFGRQDISRFKSSIHRLVSNVRSANPDALILLTTPMECHRSVTTKTKKRVKRKGRYRTVTSTGRTYAVNPNIAPLRKAILDYGKENGVAVYDWYDVAGGAGASSSWISASLFAKDRVHHSHKGYNLNGRLLYDAIMDALRSQN